VRSLPAPPNTAWFFFASPPNYLSLRDDLPAQGALAAVFRGRPLPGWLLAAGAAALPLLLLFSRKRTRRGLRRFIQEDAVELGQTLPGYDPGEWRRYAIEWRADGVRFAVDGQTVLETPLSPLGPLGLVLWVDNQYAAFNPSGDLRYGALKADQPGAIEVRRLEISQTGEPAAPSSR
jgi:hypothetical protein